MRVGRPSRTLSKKPQSASKLRGEGLGLRVTYCGDYDECRRLALADWRSVTLAAFQSAAVKGSNAAVAVIRGS